MVGVQVWARLLSYHQAVTSRRLNTLPSMNTITWSFSRNPSIAHNVNCSALRFLSSVFLFFVKMIFLTTLSILQSILQESVFNQFVNIKSYNLIWTNLNAPAPGRAQLSVCFFFQYWWEVTSEKGDLTSLASDLLKWPKSVKCLMFIISALPKVFSIDLCGGYWLDIEDMGPER